MAEDQRSSQISSPDQQFLPHQRCDVWFKESFKPVGEPNLAPYDPRSQPLLIDARARCTGIL